MSKYYHESVAVVNKHDPIVFENNSDSVFDVSPGIIFHKSGLYQVDVNERHVAVSRVNSLDWIPVTERLPEVGREILFCDDFGDIFVGHRATEHWWSVDDKVKSVIAWMPLPKPFKEVTE